MAATKNAVPDAKSYMIHIRVNEAKNVLAKDVNGKSDPFVEIQLGGDHTTKPKLKPKFKEKTKICPATLFPVWNQDFTFSLEQLTGNLRFKVYDYDKLGANDFLGQVLIRLPSLKTSRTLDGWFPLIDKKNANSQGHLYISVIVDVNDRAVGWKNPNKPSKEETKALEEIRSSLFAALEAKAVANKSDAQIYQFKGLSLCCGTWNVGNAPPPEDLSAWLDVKAGHDIYAVGVQECRYKPRKHGSHAGGASVAPAPASPGGGGDGEDGGPKLSPAEQKAADEARAKETAEAGGDWDNTLFKHFGMLLSDPSATTATATAGTASGAMGGISGGATAAAAPQHAGGKRAMNSSSKYMLIKTTYVGEIRLSVIARRDLGPRISMVERSTEATGFGHVVGNKGGAVTVMSVDDLSFCFVSSHLAAHQHKCARRNADFSEIVSGVRLGQWKTDPLHQFHHVFWMGDLNYRLEYGGVGTSKKPTHQQFETICTAIKEKKWDELFATDQLQRERLASRAFVGFNEGKYHFAPTFKVIRHKADEYNEERAPSYCDRVLWRSFAGHPVTQTALHSAPSIMTSDHKPVFSTFTVQAFTLPNGRDSFRGALTLTVTNLKARNLPVADIETKSADPYVVFHAPFFEKTYKTAVIKKNLNPDWKDGDIPAMPATLNSRLRISHSFIMIQVFDSDRVGKDDCMANGVLFLGGEHSKQSNDSKPVHFTVQLSRGGLPNGTLEGDLTLKWAAPTASIPHSKDALIKLGFEPSLF